jgi:beta-phosphoglucomutase-like phosphatase (HAD superfamily)
LTILNRSSAARRKMSFCKMKKGIQENSLSGDGGQTVSGRTKKSVSSIKAVIFDMDGVLIDSEPLWREAEMAVFRQVGLRLTESMCLETMGLRVDELVDYWYQRHPWKNFAASALEENIINAVIERIFLKGEPKEGIDAAIAYFKNKKLKIALASSSPYRIIHAVIERLKISEKFDYIYSAEEEEYGKPHPGVYLTTARKLGMISTECLAIEDSFNGVLAAKAARMKCIAIPEDTMRIDPRFVIADITLSSLREITEDVWQQVS